MNNKLQPITGASKKILRKKSAKYKLYDVTRGPEDWTAELELLRGYLLKFGVIIDDVEIMTHILSNLPEEYNKMVENLEDELDDKIDMFAIKIFRDKI